mmetsp:Transcript_53803/g.161020  ORF Transcript_53803/g.161020 Transcript_53803/m.161020 type:complete len:660 (-) Transcript_53803:103-2082(-)
MIRSNGNNAIADATCSSSIRGAAAGGSGGIGDGGAHHHRTQQNNSRRGGAGRGRLDTKKASAAAQEAAALRPYRDFSRALQLPPTLSSRDSTNTESGDGIDGGKGGMNSASSSSSSSAALSSGSSNGGGARETFPAKLHAILSHSEKVGHCIQWLPHGRSFRIVDPEELEHRALSEYFAHRSFPSFVRQINGWGFQRVTNGADYGSYYHELFLRGIPHLAQRMRRPAPGGPRKNRKEANAVPAPDFDEISRLRPLPAKPGDSFPPIPSDDDKGEDREEEAVSKLERDGVCLVVRACDAEGSSRRMLTSTTNNPLSSPSPPKPDTATAASSMGATIQVEKEGQEMAREESLKASPATTTSSAATSIGATNDSFLADYIHRQQQEEALRRGHIGSNSKESCPALLLQSLQRAIPTLTQQHQPSGAVPSLGLVQQQQSNLPLSAGLVTSSGASLAACDLQQLLTQHLMQQQQQQAQQEKIQQQQLLQLQLLKLRATVAAGGSAQPTLPAGSPSAAVVSLLSSLPAEALVAAQAAQSSVADAGAAVLLGRLAAAQSLGVAMPRGGLPLVGAPGVGPVASLPPPLPPVFSSTAAAAALPSSSSAADIAGNPVDLLANLFGDSGARAGANVGTAVSASASSPGAGRNALSLEQLRRYLQLRNNIG